MEPPANTDQRPETVYTVGQLLCAVRKKDHWLCLQRVLTTAPAAPTEAAAQSVLRVFLGSPRQLIRSVKVTPTTIYMFYVYKAPLHFCAFCKLMVKIII